MRPRAGGTVSADAGGDPSGDAYMWTTRLSGEVQMTRGFLWSGTREWHPGVAPGRLQPGTAGFSAVVKPTYNREMIADRRCERVQQCTF